MFFKKAEKKSSKREQTACFTGHRKISDNIDFVAQKTSQEIEKLIKQGYLYFGAGGARGFDMLASFEVLKLKEMYPNIHLILVLPFPNQYEKDRGWTQKEIDNFNFLKSKASKVVTLAEEYSSGVYYRRNRHLVDSSSVCIAYQTNNNSGTSYTTNYASSQKCKVINIAKLLY